MQRVSGKRRLFPQLLVTLIVLSAIATLPRVIGATDSSSVQWINPVDGQTVSGAVRLEVSAPSGTAKVGFFVDNTWIHVDSDGSPWTSTLDATSLSSGQHVLKATARDANNNVMGRGTVTINVGSATQTATPTASPTSTATSTPTSGTTGTSSAPAGSATIVRTVNGDDWTLPGTVTPSAHSAIYGSGTLNSIMTARAPMFTWADLQTGDNQFDWSSLDKQLSNGPIVLRLKAGTPSAVPDFIRNRHNWPTFVGSDGLTELPQWSPGWVDEWKPFITALGARYRNNPNLVGVQLGITASGEPGMLKTDIANFERLGLTPTVLRDFLLGYQGDTLTAFQGAPWKVFSVVKPYFIGAYSGNFSKEQYAQAVRDGTIPLTKNGLGIRGSGMSEDFEAPTAWSEWSQFTNNMVSTHDSTFQPLLLQDHIDGQLENFYGSNSKVSTSDTNKIRAGMRLALLRAMADQYSYLWLDADDIDFLGSALPRYVQLSMGKRPSESQDALLVLGSFNGVNAWPRWLTPLNLGATGDGQSIDTSGLGFDSCGCDKLGRVISSDLQLAIDDRVVSPTSSGTVQVTVTYLDTAGAWHLEYESSNGIVSAPQIKGQGSGVWKTVTLSLPSAKFGGHLVNGADLRLVTDNGPVTIQVVRVIK